MALTDYPFRIYYGPADDPLNNFYIPALSASVRYDRSAGFFSSSALAVAAAGVARLIRNGGHMRLLVGASLDERDVEAIQQGYDLKARVTERLLQHFADPQDALLRQRLEVMAWMVAEGLLDIKVVLPRDRNGRPVPAAQAQDYYHPKIGIFTDAGENRIAFSGSVNESETAWQHNYETFSVYFSWNETRPYLAQVAIRFDRLWQGEEPDWIALDIPQAVRERLLQYRPAQAPTHDPLEPEPSAPPAHETQSPVETGVPEAERLRFQFVRDAPFLPNAASLGAATCAIVPWPHQTRVAQEVIGRFPDRALLCDEVGLGKTIEAGLVIRQLLLSGRVKRCLILAPKSVVKQWQQELYEKFSLDVPRYDVNKFWDVHDAPLSAPNGNPWDAFDVLLAGSQLAKRGDRRDELLVAKGWDLVVVDEAHHARRKDFKERAYRPNRLLGLLNELNARRKAASLLLMTATPMQVHPLEVWDLLTVLGLGGRWRADEDNFLNFFQEMRKPFAGADWELIFDLVRDHLATQPDPDPTFAAQAQAELGPVKWAELDELPNRPGERVRRLQNLGQAAEPYVQEFARRHTPLRHYILRNTRALLREYKRRGILHANVPTRRPHLERIPLRPEEEKLYTRIEEYTSNFYQKYENERRGLGFIMTIYRRRLTSSFYAVRCSLERRLKFLRGVLRPDEIYDDDDVEQEELDLDLAEEGLGEGDRARFKQELDYVADFVRELRALSSADSKLEQLKTELNRVFMQRDKVIVFTQYTDTMDYLRDQLREVYGTQVACYSGRGGEVWTGMIWADTTKEQVKNDFRAGKVRILLCTESASEGLNLQTCGVLVNYDMPWNPMRVEQRIGRIDRIGQEYPEVWISNYFYENTIEDLIYQRLADRIDWFEVVVGDLQPILAEVGEMTRRLAMLPATERQARLEQEIAALRQRLQDREVESLNLDQFLEPEDYHPGPVSPVTLADLERLLTQSVATGRLFRSDPGMKGAYLLAWRGQTLPVTFSPACFDEHPDTVRFISYGSPLLADLLAVAPAPEGGASAPVVRCASDGDIPLRAWYAPRDGETDPAPIETLAQLEGMLKSGNAAPAIDDLFRERAGQLFAAQVAETRAHQAEMLNHRAMGVYLAERARGQRLLCQAAMVEIALGQQPELFDGGVYPTAFNEQAVRGLQRHHFPWAALLQLAFEPGLAPRADDPYYHQIADSTRESLRGRLNQLTEQARQAVTSLKAAHEAVAPPVSP
ncbi:MAG: helicase-related protein [Anaerolineae bacterium]